MEEAAKKAELQETDLGELTSNKEGYRNLTNNGVPETRVLSIISAVTAGFSLLNGIASQVDVGRVCAIGLSNHGDRKLIEPTWYLYSGIIKDILPREILPGDAGIFTFQKTSYSSFGTAGMLTYTIEGTGLQVEVMWSVPFLYGFYSNGFDIEIKETQPASETIYNTLYYDKFQEVSNGGHWVHRTENNVNVHAAMTNNAKASLLVEVFYNFTTPISNIFGK